MTPLRNGFPQHLRRTSAWVLLRTVLFRSLLFGLLWWILSESTSILPLFTAGVIFLAVGTSLLLVPPGTWNFRIASLPGFLVYFLSQSVLAGIDVARRAFHPHLPLSPGIVTYPLSLKQMHSRVFFVWIVSLLPGTAGVFLDEKRVRIHVLDVRQFDTERLNELAERIKRIFELSDQEEPV
ncbi:MAG: Na+/H+ antiporter subunit E [Desulfovibrionales bacterium]